MLGRMTALLIALAFLSNQTVAETGNLTPKQKVVMTWSYLMSAYRLCGKTRDDPVVLADIKTYMQRKFLEAGLEDGDAERIMNGAENVAVDGKNAIAESIACSTMDKWKSSRKD